MRRVAVLVLIAALAILALALPATAQTDGGGQTVTIEELATVPGAVAASWIVVEVASAIFTLTAWAKRVTAVVAGIVIVLAATIITGATSIGELVLATITGMTAGLAASKAHEIGTEGLNHAVTRRT